MNEQKENWMSPGLVKLHTEAKELLADQYNEARVDGCIALQSPGQTEKIFADLKIALTSAKDEEEKTRIRELWLAENDIFHEGL